MNKPYIYITRNLPEQVISSFKDNFEVGIWKEEFPVPREVLLEEAKRAEGLLIMLTDKIDKELLDTATNLKVISTMAVGYDNIDIPLAAEKGIIVTHTPGVLSDATADLTFGLLMATARRIAEANRYLLEGNWIGWGPMLMAGQQIYGSTIGIIGMGRIGEAVAKRATGFDMEILYHNRNRKLEIEEQLGAKYRSLDNLLKESDFVVLLTPLTSETENLMGSREFDLMKETAVFINASRGATVDEKALYEALVEGKIWAAGLDVFREEPVPLDNPLLKLDNVVAIPHIGSASIQTRLKMAMMAAKDLKAALENNKPEFVVNKQLLV